MRCDGAVLLVGRVEAAVERDDVDVGAEIAQATIARAGVPSGAADLALAGQEGEDGTRARYV